MNEFKTEKEKMIEGLIYDADDEELKQARFKCENLCFQFNNIKNSQDKKRKEILQNLLASFGENSFFRGPIYFDYGMNTYVGNNCYANYNLTILDVCPVYIEDDVFMGPNVSLLTPLHPLLYEERKVYYDDKKGYFHDDEYGKPITIKKGVWLASNVIVGPGVTIGEGSVIGMGSVVTHDIPDHVLAYGNPCRVIRKIDERDMIRGNKDE